MQAPPIPKNPTLWSLRRLHDHATRWLDHASTQEDFNFLEDFIIEIEVRLIALSEDVKVLENCFLAATDHE